MEKTIHGRGNGENTDWENGHVYMDDIADKIHDKDVLIKSTRAKFPGLSQSDLEEIYNKVMQDRDPRFFGEAMEKKPLSYLDWYNRFMDKFRKEHPHSTAPRDHVLSYIYDKYVDSFDDQPLKKNEMARPKGKLTAIFPQLAADAKSGKLKQHADDWLERASELSGLPKAEIEPFVKSFRKKYYFDSAVRYNTSPDSEAYWANEHKTKKTIQQMVKEWMGGVAGIPNFNAMCDKCGMPANACKCQEEEDKEKVVKAKLPKGLKYMKEAAKKDKDSDNYWTKNLTATDPGPRSTWIKKSTGEAYEFSHKQGKKYWLYRIAGPRTDIVTIADFKDQFQPGPSVKEAIDLKKNYPKGSVLCSKHGVVKGAGKSGLECSKCGEACMSLDKEMPESFGDVTTAAPNTHTRPIKMTRDQLHDITITEMKKMISAYGFGEAISAASHPDNPDYDWATYKEKKEIEKRDGLVKEGHGDCPHCFGSGESTPGEECPYCHGTGEMVGQPVPKKESFKKPSGSISIDVVDILDEYETWCQKRGEDPDDDAAFIEFLDKEEPFDAPTADGRNKQIKQVWAAWKQRFPSL